MKNPPYSLTMRDLTTAEAGAWIEEKMMSYDLSYTNIRCGLNSVHLKANIVALDNMNGTLRLFSDVNSRPDVIVQEKYLNITLTEFKMEGKRLQFFVIESEDSTFSVQVHMHARTGVI